LQKHGVEHRVKEPREGADHDQHFKGNDKVKNNSAPEERFFCIHNTPP